MGINAMFLDACAIIYLIEANDEKSNRIRQLVSDYMERGTGDLLVSSLSILECLVLPKKQNDVKLLAEYEAFFASEGVQVIDISRTILYFAVDLRAKYKIRTPDALQLASALSRGVKFVSADKDLVKVAEVKIILL
jgi:predicted nucleic acid-binding protein